eukprot:Awhi_evm1s15129
MILLIKNRNKNHHYQQQENGKEDLDTLSLRSHHQSRMSMNSGSTINTNQSYHANDEYENDSSFLMRPEYDLDDKVRQWQ